MATILIVEDEEPSRRLLTRVFGIDGHRAIAAGNSAEAMELARRERPQLLVADWMLREETTGLEVARRIAAELPELRVLFLTGLPLDITSPDVKDLRYYSFLQKPCDVETLRREAAALLAKGSESDS